MRKVILVIIIIPPLTAAASLAKDNLQFIIKDAFRIIFKFFSVLSMATMDSILSLNRLTSYSI